MTVDHQAVPRRPQPALICPRCQALNPGAAKTCRACSASLDPAAGALEESGAPWRGIGAPKTYAKAGAPQPLPPAIVDALIGRPADPKPFRLLAIDLGGAQVGHASFLCSGGEPVLQEAETWHIHNPSRTQSPGARWLKLGNLLKAEIAKYGRPDLIAYEEVMNHVSPKKGGRGVSFNVHAAHAYGAGEGILLAFCEEQHLEVVAVTISAVKNAAVGKGGGKGTDKQAVMDAAVRRWGALHRFDGFDSADAAFIGLAALIDLKYAADTPKVAKEKPVKKGKRTLETAGLF